MSTTLVDMGEIRAIGARPEGTPWRVGLSERILNTEPCLAALFYGHLRLSTAFAPRDWQVHEMLFGYVAAVVAGFLLTAIPHWTGQLPLQGKPLIVLFLIWVAGRIAVSTSIWIGWAPAAVIDIAFLALLAMAAVREHVGVPECLMTQVAEGVLDIAIMYVPQNRPGIKIELLLGKSWCW